MTQNAEKGLLHTGPSREDSAAGGKSVPTVAQTPGRVQQPGLFPGDDTLPVARPVPMQTSGRLEFAARCPECLAWHRHVSLGEKHAPCGARYELQPRRGRAAA